MHHTHTHRPHSSADQQAIPIMLLVVAGAIVLGSMLYGLLSGSFQKPLVPPVYVTEPAP